MTPSRGLKTEGGTSTKGSRRGCGSVGCAVFGKGRTGRDSKKCRFEVSKK